MHISKMGNDIASRRGRSGYPEGEEATSINLDLAPGCFK